MRIIENEGDGIIGELLYITMEFDRKEILDGGVGIVSQGAVQRYFAAKRPDLKPKKYSGIKMDFQNNTLTMRVGVTNHVGGINPVGVDPMVASAAPEYGYVGQDQKLLNPGYDELKAKYDALKVAVENDSQDFNLATKLTETQKMYGELENELHEVGAKYDALKAACEVKILQEAADLTGCAEIDVKAMPHLTDEDAADSITLNGETIKYKKTLGLNTAGEYSGAHGSVHTNDAVDSVEEVQNG